MIVLALGNHHLPTIGNASEPPAAWHQGLRSEGRAFAHGQDDAGGHEGRWLINGVGT